MNDEKVLVEAICGYITECMKNHIFPRYALWNYVQVIRTSNADCDKSECMQYLGKEHTCYHLHDIWRFLNADDLYETIEASDVPIDWFAFSVVGYVYKVAGFTGEERANIFMMFDEWQTKKDTEYQSYFNYFIRLALNKLQVFYG